MPDVDCLAQPGTRRSRLISAVAIAGSMMVTTKVARWSRSDWPQSGCSWIFTKVMLPGASLTVLNWFG
jgi:hypothetical protein